LHFGPGTAAEHPQDGEEPTPPPASAEPPAPEGSEERFAFFAAFRAAADKAREEAGIDDRRVGR
jgi:hypothetical protein